MNLRSLKTPFEPFDLQALSHLNNSSGIVTAEELIAKNPSIVSECAALSADAYHDENRKPLPPGWTQLKHKQYSTGYAGSCYVKNHPNPTHIVFAHRGTVPTDIRNIAADLLGILMNDIPFLHFKSMYDFFCLMSNRLYNETYSREILKNTQFVVTGHSLGAALADLTGTLGNCYPTITFENPGTKEMFKKCFKMQGLSNEHIALLLKQFNQTCRVYQAGVNMINTCNEQLGRTFRIQDLTYEWPKTLEFPMSSSFALNTFYMKDYTLDQHAIKKISKKLESNYQTIEINNPIGFNAGYVDYLDKSNKDYWENYFNILWNNAIEKKPEDHNKFLRYCFDILSGIQKQAKGISLMIEKQPSLNNSATLFGKPHKKINDLDSSFVMVEKPDTPYMEQPKPSAWCTIS